MGLRHRRGWVWSGVLVAAMAVVAQGCATSAGEQVTRAAADAVLPPSQEEQLGRQMRSQVLQKYPPLQDPQVQQYVDQVGQRVVRTIGGRPQGIDYSFTVVKGDQINAFTMPGGDIYVYTGLLKAADNEAQLAGVLAHEVGHVVNRDVAEQLVTQYGLQALASAALGQNPGVIAQLVASVAEQGYLLHYSRAQESDADQVGLKLMARAGYNPEAFVSFFQILERQQKGPQPPEFLSSHPSPQNRIAQAQQEIRQMSNPPTALDRDRYQQVMRQLR